jgi:hypothetical protein
MLTQLSKLQECCVIVICLNASIEFFVMHALYHASLEISLHEFPFFAPGFIPLVLAMALFVMGELGLILTQRCE